MESELLSPEIQEFIKLHVDADVVKLALMKNPFPQTHWSSILEQIASRQKAKDKLSTWFLTDEIIYPAKISVEQTSSEKTALYKSSLISGKKLIDLTGGFGVDAYYFSKVFESVVHCEMKPELSSIVKHNVEKFEVKNIDCHVGDSFDVLKNINSKFDWIYIDPSRRNDSKGKVFMLKDCLPNVVDLMPDYFEHTENILIKTAPILDISAGLNELKHVTKIHIVAVENEVKELLWEIQKDHLGAISIMTANLKKEQTDIFAFELGHDAVVQYGLPEKYLYEPNAAIMKSGGFDEICERFNIEKLHSHSQLFTSNEMIDFPGRTFEIKQSVPYQKNEMKRWLENKKANVTTRNFPDSVEEIRKKWKIKDGGDLYCFFTTDMNNRKIVLLCGKI